jgi:hypothetical protein
MPGTHPLKPLRIACATLAALACLPQTARAVPDVSAAEARAFLGGRTGKVVYLRYYDSRLYYIDLSDSALRERPIANDSYCNSPMISPEGTRVLYESLGSIYIRPLEENTQTRYTVLSGTVKPGYLMEPRWWIDPATKAEYVIYTTGYLEEHEWPQKSGQTFIQKIVNNVASGAPKMLLPFVMGGGRSRNGLWGATSNHTTGMFKFVEGKVDSAFYGLRNWMDDGFLLGCNPSISPSMDAGRQARMMHLSSGQGKANGKLYDNHKAVFIRSWNDKSVDEPLWYLGPLGDNSNDDGTGNQFWNFPEWSNDENYFVLIGSKEIDVVDTADLYFCRINYGGPNRLLRIMKGGSKFYFPDLWIQDGAQPARILLGKASLSFSSLKKDTADPPAQSIAVTNGGDGTLPALKIGPLAKWLKVSVTGNGTNTPTLQVSVARDSVPPGEYKDTVSVSFGAGADSQSFAVAFHYSDPVATTLAPWPATAVALKGDTVRLRAIAYDQNGRPMDPQPAVSWSGLDGFDVSADGLAHADTVPWHAGYAVARSGALACTTMVWTAKNYFKLDAGSGPDAPAPGWSGDSAFKVDATAPFKTVSSKDGSVDMFGSADPAPAAVYRNYQYPAPAYRFPDLPNGRYRVRFHFTSPDTGIQELKGAFSARLQGKPVLEDYKLPAGTAEGGLRGDVKEASVTVSNGQGLFVDFAPGTPGGSALSGLEAYDEGMPPILVTAPNGGEKVGIGDTLNIRWIADSLVTSVGIQISLDSGLSWHAVTRRKSVQLTDADWGDYRWPIPDTLDGASLVSGKAMISVYDYFGADRDRSDEVFAIGSVGVPIVRQPASERPLDWFAGVSGDHRLWLRLPANGAWKLTLSDVRGRSIRVAELTGSGLKGWETGMLPRGVYRLAIEGPGLVSARMVPLF